MNTRNKTFRLRPETIFIQNKINEALYPIMKRAVSYGFSYESFSFLVNKEVNDMIDYEFDNQLQEQLEKEGEND